MAILTLAVLLLPVVSSVVFVKNIKETCGFRGPAIVYPGRGLMPFLQLLIEKKTRKKMSKGDGVAVLTVYPNLKRPAQSLTYLAVSISKVMWFFQLTVEGGHLDKLLEVVWTAFFKFVRDCAKLSNMYYSQGNYYVLTAP